MGGAIAVGFRFPNGEVKVQERSTNTIPYWFNNIRLFNFDEDYINKYRSALRDDSHDLPLAPYGYGLILVDYMTNNLLGMQGYTGLGFRDPVHLHPNFCDADDKAVYRELLLQGRISVRRYKDNRTITDEPPFPKEMSIEQLMTIANQLRVSPDYVRFKIDFSPLHIINFGEGSAEECDKFLDKLYDLKFDISDSDLEGWKDYKASFD